MSDDITNLDDDSAAPQPRAPQVRRGPAPGPRAQARQQVREEVRPEVRADVREEARQVATKKLELTEFDSEDQFHIDPRMIPPGMSWEWKAENIVGKPNTTRMTRYKINHWTEVPQDRYPGLVTRKEGMVLMERPAYLTEESTKRQFKKAQQQARQVGARIAETPDGTFTRQHPSAQRNTFVNREFGPGESGGRGHSRMVVEDE